MADIAGDALMQPEAALEPMGFPAVVTPKEPLDFTDGATFSKYEKAITTSLLEKKNSYYGSRCYQLLKTRYIRLRDSINLKFGSTLSNSFYNNNSGQFNSKIGMPILRPKYKLRRALTKEYLRQEPLITLDPIGSTPKENANNMQQVLNLNYQHTKFRQKAFDSIVHNAAAYGVGVGFSQFVSDEKWAFKTAVQSDGSVGRSYMITKRTKNCPTSSVHPLNYFQDPEIGCAEDSSFQGFIDQWYMHNIFAIVNSNDDRYIIDNVKQILDKAKNGIEDKNRFNEGGPRDYSRYGVDDVIRMFTKINIEGNESDDTDYYVEIVGDKIVRIQVGLIDDDLRPFSIFRYFPKAEYWWGNSDGEDVFPHEQYMNLLMSLKGDATLRQMNQWVLFDKAIGLDMQKLRETPGGGMIGVDYNGRKAQELFYNYNQTDLSGNNVDWMLREVKESMQRQSSSPDLQRSSNQGGMVNNTATAASIIAGTGDVLERDAMEVFAMGLIHNCEVTATILQAELPDEFAIRANPKEAEKILQKLDILGSFGYKVESSLNKSRETELIRKQNFLTWLMNAMGNGSPQLQGVQVGDIVRDIIRAAEVGNPDEILPPEEVLQNQPGAVPSAMMPGMENSGAVTDMGGMNAPM